MSTDLSEPAIDVKSFRDKQSRGSHWIPLVRTCSLEKRTQLLLEPQGQSREGTSNPELSPSLSFAPAMLPLATAARTRGQRSPSESAGVSQPSGTQSRVGKKRKQTGGKGEETWDHCPRQPPYERGGLT